MDAAETKTVIIDGVQTGYSTTLVSAPAEAVPQRQEQIKVNTNLFRYRAGGAVSGHAADGGGDQD